ncbi:hypothetical protein Q4543_16655 [Salipiger sp. 1_MG-2023]|uniref:hypothetical protein n=1 Tax=Salipiger sp. 1_MG-2023 TaxID=3062665 RepID=UPI0026E1A9F0|nr:hypothetical protein [Salipiger sp. 1_MG-2023]MDO6587140.1 hypothetical protein [Salipiger sp. 1_MG-2023]MDO6587147.1 hypothetical protein [Salipiger sp. 1_MG-2023]
MPSLTLLDDTGQPLPYSGLHFRSHLYYHDDEAARGQFFELERSELDRLFANPMQYKPSIVWKTHHRSLNGRKGELSAVGLIAAILFELWHLNARLTTRHAAAEVASFLLRETERSSRVDPRRRTGKHILHGDHSGSAGQPQGWTVKTSVEDLEKLWRKHSAVVHLAAAELGTAYLIDPGDHPLVRHQRAAWMLAQSAACYEDFLVSWHPEHFSEQVEVSSGLLPANRGHWESDPLTGVLVRVDYAPDTNPKLRAVIAAGIQKIVHLNTDGDGRQPLKKRKQPKFRRKS